MKKQVFKSSILDLCLICKLQSVLLFLVFHFVRVKVILILNPMNLVVILFLQVQMPSMMKKIRSENNKTSFQLQDYVIQYQKDLASFGVSTPELSAHDRGKGKYVHMYI